jgi:hypothetical protein
LEGSLSKRYPSQRRLRYEHIRRVVYSVEGDTLRICVNATGSSRPTAFASKKGDDVFWLWELKRAVAPAKGGK